MAELNHFKYNPICDQIVNIQNWTDQNIADGKLASTLSDFLVKAFTPVVFGIGFLGNVAIILLPARVKTMRTITNFYLANLAGADLLFLSMQTIDQSRRYSVVGENFHKSLGCGIYRFFDRLVICAAILLITLVGLDRYLAVCHPLTYRSIKSKKRTYYIPILFIYMIAIVFGLLGTLSSGRLVHFCILWPPHEKYKNFPELLKRCWPIHPVFEKVSAKVCLGLFITAVIVNVTINTRIVQRLTRSPLNESGHQQNQQVKQRITWMLMLNSIIFFCTLAPTNTLILLSIFNLSHPRIFWDIALSLAMVNSAVNPILYGAFSPSYRRGFLKAFGLRRNHIVPTEEQECDRIS